MTRTGTYANPMLIAMPNSTGSFSLVSPSTKSTVGVMISIILMHSTSMMKLIIVAMLNRTAS